MLFNISFFSFVVKFNKLLFGTPGIPSIAFDTIDGIKKLKSLALDAMELEFVRSINVSKEKAFLVKESAEKNNIVLTCHGQYYINLNAKEKIKVEKSKQMILAAARRAFECSAFSITWHMAYYLKMEKEKVYENVKKELKEIISKLKDESINIWIRPETTGKNTQFGSLEEIVKISKELEMVLPCIDFSHLHARSNGKINSFNDFIEILSFIEKELGREALDQMHCHVSGIKYSEKGERNHLNLLDSDFNYLALLSALNEFKCKGVIISESPNIEYDSILLKESYEKIKKRKI
jgi:deoxyribonuclease-4